MTNIRSGNQHEFESKCSKHEERHGHLLKEVLSDLSRRSTQPVFLDNSQGLKTSPNWQSVRSEFAKIQNGVGREKIEKEAPCIIRLSSANEPP